MLRALWRHPLLRGCAEVVADATLYVMALLVVIVVLERLLMFVAAWT